MWTYSPFSSAAVMAFNEAAGGSHVAHIQSEDGARKIAIRPWPTNGGGPGTTSLTLTVDGSDPVSQDVNTLEAVDTIIWLLTAPIVLDQDETLFDCWINQGIRECEIIKVNKTRLRVEYEMPNAGLMGGWMHYRDFGSLRFIR